MRIAPLLLGLGVGEALAEESFAEEDRSSPIFAIRAPSEPAPRVGAPPPQTAVTRQLAELIRYDVAAMGPVPATSADPAAPAGETLQLEKMTVKVKKVLAPPVREGLVEKFTRTGHLLEFSKTKRLMLGPRGDKVGLMFSFDW